MGNFNIPKEHSDLWSRLLTFKFDANYANMLAEQQHWKSDFTTSVIDEYRKFLFLRAITSHTICPSRPVDEALHLHLRYTVSFWDELCAGVIGKPIHHYPGRRFSNSVRLFAAIYWRTLDDYTQVFGTPPGDVWGAPDSKFSNWHEILSNMIPAGIETDAKSLCDYLESLEIHDIGG